jgi:hypothetical protein
MTTSSWKLTYDYTGTPVVLLNYGEKLEDELRIDGQRVVAVVPLVRSASPALRNQGNAALRLSYARLLDSATDAAARQAMMTALITALAADPKPLKIEAAGVTDRYWACAAAIVTAVAPRKYLGSPKPRRVDAVEITAVTLTEVIP